MKIARISLGIIKIPLWTPFKTALRTVEYIEDWIVKVEGDDESAGFGEAPPTAVITGDTMQSIEAAIRYFIAPSIAGMPLDSPEDLDAVMAKMDRSIARNTSAKAAVDMALYDLYTKSIGIPLYRYLGKEEPQSLQRDLETDLTISVNEVEEMVRDSLEAKKRGFHVLKVKVGKGGDKDVLRLKEIRSAVGSEMVLRVDANQGWTREEAVRTIRMMEDAGLDIELVEQPVSSHDFKGLQWVSSQVETPILADESVFSYEDAERLLEEHAADMINIKLMKTGGIHEALRIINVAQRCQVPCMMGCMLESKVSVSAGAHLAAAKSCVTMADLDGPSLCREDPYAGGPVFDGAVIRMQEEPGIGIREMPVMFEEIVRRS